MSSLGLYLAVPFCKAKCSFCNFASDAFAPARMEGYVGRLVQEIQQSKLHAAQHDAVMPLYVDTIYLGGGTPSLLPPALIEGLFAAMRAAWQVDPDAETTVECAPGQLSDESLNAYLAAGVNRLSFGVQSFVDHECSAVGRLHTRQQTLDELARLRRAGVSNLGFDLICGLPHQTRTSWRETLQVAIDTGVEHMSVYMLEVDEDSRLGAESLRGGVRYGAGLIPKDDAVAEMYQEACELLNANGLEQYEISNFAREGRQSRHNRRYWERKPYLGLGLDAHSMLEYEAGVLRFANCDDLDAYMQSNGPVNEFHVDTDAAWEESVFLGLRLLEGVRLSALRQQFGRARVDSFAERATELQRDELMQVRGDVVSLSAKGRLVSSSIFGELLAEESYERVD